MVQLRLLPAPAQMGKKPRSATSQPEKVQRDTQLVRWDGFLVACPTDVAAAPLGSKNPRQFQETAMDLESGVRSQSLLNDFDLTCQVSASSFVKWSQQSLPLNETTMNCQMYRNFGLTCTTLGVREPSLKQHTYAKAYSVPDTVLVPGDMQQLSV